MRLKLPQFKFRQGKYKWTVLSFSTRIFIKTKCQVFLVMKYTCSIRSSPVSVGCSQEAFEGRDFVHDFVSKTSYGVVHSNCS